MTTNKTNKVNADVAAGLDMDAATNAAKTSDSTTADLAKFGREIPGVDRSKPVRRRAINGLTEKLKVYGEIPGFHLHIANDDGNRLVEMQAAGYSFVDANEIEGTNGNISSFNTDPGGKVRFVVGTQAQSEPMYAYLMKLPLEFFDEDQAALETSNARIDSAIINGQFNQQANERRYIPSTGITVNSRLYRPS
jgi:hypothetical protein